jgi:hypothetical protein
VPTDDVDLTPPPESADPAGVPDPDEISTVEEPSTWPNWYYAGPDRIYTNIPVTVTTGDIVTWHSDPGLGDGSWTVTTKAANKLPDNHREDPATLLAAEMPEEG